jgi:hypothetical protein
MPTMSPRNTWMIDSRCLPKTSSKRRADGSQGCLVRCCGEGWHGRGGATCRRRRVLPVPATTAPKSSATDEERARSRDVSTRWRGRSRRPACLRCPASPRADGSRPRPPGACDPDVARRPWTGTAPIQADVPAPSTRCRRCPRTSAVTTGDAPTCGRGSTSVGPHRQRLLRVIACDRPTGTRRPVVPTWDHDDRVLDGEIEGEQAGEHRSGSGLSEQLDPVHAARCSESDPFRPGDLDERIGERERGEGDHVTADRARDLVERRQGPGLGDDRRGLVVRPVCIRVRHRLVPPRGAGPARVLPGTGMGAERSGGVPAPRPAVCPGTPGRGGHRTAS